MSKKDLSDYVVGKNHIQITIRVILITVSCIGLAVVAGLAFDKQFQTSPLGLITGVVLGFPLTQVVIYKKFKSFPENLKENKDAK